MKKFSPQLYRGDAKYTQQPIDIDLNTVINLETGIGDLGFWYHPDNSELRYCLRNRITLYDFALSSLFPPPEYDVKIIMDLMRDRGRPLLVHCRHGRERTGFIVAAYRLRVENWSFDDAYAEWKQEGCRWPIYWLWKSALRKWEKRPTN